MRPPAYAELQMTSNFSFLRGASHPHELVERAAALGHAALALTDRNTLAGIVRAHVAAKAAGLRFVTGCRLDLGDAPSVLVYPTDRAAYGRLCRLLTRGKRRAPKGECRLRLVDLLDHAEGLIVIALPPEARFTRDVLDGLAAHLGTLRERIDDRLYVAAHNHLRGDDRRRLLALGDLADALGIPLVATNDVHGHTAERQPLQDVLTCVRLRCTLEGAGRRLFANAERHLKSPAVMRRLFAERPDAVARTLEIGERCRFSLDELRYEHPDEGVGSGETAQQTLTRLTWAGAAEHYPEGSPDKVRATLEHELRLIERLGYARYFLTIHDIVREARRLGILCQGRGSAANSAVCYVLGVTAVDPAKHDVLFERFVSAERGEPPDIDVDFEHERREEIIRHVYEKYGRHRAGLAATVVHYRPRMAVREVGRVFGLSTDTVDRLARAIGGWGDGRVSAERAREAGLDPSDPTLARVLALAGGLVGFPRHLSQHVGGFVITKGRLDETVPVMNAAMAERTAIEWDKDDLDALGMLKVDLLALGMLTALRKSFALIAARTGRPFGLADVPQEDPATYAMIQEADTVGVFQIESRAQMTMLPRLKPKIFYDLVIEVAIVRPGPIQGDMVHPYLRRREGLEDAEYPKEELRAVLGKTLGVPLFQEQAMRVAIVAAGFTPEEADRLRRSMATFKNKGGIDAYRERLIGGMVRNGYDRGFAERCFRQLEGFGSYGFPESHAVSFALLAYASAWVKRHHPAAFCAALLNSQPMGFHAPAQLVRDAREHGVEVRPVDVNRSTWGCTLEETTTGPAVRLGFRQIKGFHEADALRLVAARGEGYRDVREVRGRGGPDVAALERLADADAFRSLGLDRRAALWAIRALGAAPLPLFETTTAAPGDNRPPPDPPEEPAVLLPATALGEAVAEDYRHTALSLRAHPLGLLRPRLLGDGYRPAGTLADGAHGARAAVAGLVLNRQRPGTASGVVFLTLEDETGVANVVLWSRLFDRFRRAAIGAVLLGVRGRVQREGIVTHLVAEHLEDLSDRLRGLSALDGRAGLPRSRDFR